MDKANRKERKPITKYISETVSVLWKALYIVTGYTDIRMPRAVLSNADRIANPLTPGVGSCLGNLEGVFET